MQNGFPHHTYGTDDIAKIGRLCYLLLTMIGWKIHPLSLPEAQFILYGCSGDEAKSFPREKNIAIKKPCPYSPGVSCNIDST